MNDEEILSLIEDLKNYDNEEGYELDYDEVKSELEDTIKELTKKEERALEYLHPLLNRAETWSCLFALKILRKIKSEKSIPYLVNFIKNNENSDYWDGCEEAMFALSAVGKSAVDPLLKEVKSDFENKIYYFYLVSALTGIKDEKVYHFMKEIVEDYIKNHEKYKGWFEIGHFVHDFETQERKEILPLLKELNSLRDLSERDRAEIHDTIMIIEDPESYERKIEESAEKLKPLLERLFSYKKNGKKRKIGRNEPCPCGSGKKYKKCCGKIA